MTDTLDKRLIDLRDLYDVTLPKPEIRGEGKVLYRCANCDEMMEPEAAVIVADLSYHPDHAPELTDGR